MANFTPTGVEFVTRGLSKYLADVGKAGKANVDFGNSADGIGSRLAKAGGSVLKFGAAAVAAAGAAGIGALGAGLAASTATAISFESAFAGVIKTTDGLTNSAGQLNAAGQELRQQFVGLSKDIPLTFEELAKIGELGGQLGVGKESLVGFTESIAALGVSTNLTTEEAATAIARFQNIYQIASADVGQNTNQVGSAIVELGNNFATTERDITAFAERIAGAGRIAGLTQSDVLGIGAAMSSVGIESEAGGTAVQKVLIDMNNAVAGATTGFVDNTKAIDKNVQKLQDLNTTSARLEATLPGLQDEMLAQYDAFIAAGGSAEEWGRQLGDKNRQKAFDTALAIRNLTQETNLLRESQGQPVPAGQLEKFAQVAGVSAAEFKKLWQEDASQAFEMFVTGLGKQGDNAAGTLDDLGLADQRLVRAFLSLSGAGDLLGRAIDTSNKAFEDGTALHDEAAKRYATTESQLIILKNNFRAIGDSIGSYFLPVINKVITAVKDFINLKVAPFIDNMKKKIGELTAVFQAGGLFGSRSGSFGSAGLLSALGVSPETQVMLQNFIAGIKDFVNEVMWLINNIQNVPVEGEFGLLSRYFNVTSFQELAANLITAIPGVLNTVITSITGYLETQGPAISAAVYTWVGQFWGWVNNVVNGAGAALAAIIAVIGQWAMSGETQTMLSDFGFQLGQMLVNGLIIFAENQDQMVAIMLKIAGGLAIAIGAIGGILIAVGGQIVAGILSGILEKLGVDLQPATISELGSILTGIANNALLAAKIIGTNILLGISQGILDTISQLTTTLNQIGFIIVNTVKTALGIASPSTIFMEVGMNIVQGLIDGITNMLGNLGTVASTIFSALFGGGEEGGGFDVTVFVSTLPEALLNIQTMFTTMSTLITTIGTYLSTVLVEQITVGFTVFVMWLDMVIIKLTDIHAVQFPTITNMLLVLVATWQSGFAAVNGILQTTISLLQAIVAGLGQVASSAAGAVDAMKKFDSAKSSIESLVKAVEKADKAFQKMEASARRAAAAARSAGSSSGAATGIGFSNGVGFANGTGLGWTVPPGFPNDSFPMRVESGEQVLVTPRGTSIDEVVLSRLADMFSGISGGDTINMNIATLATPQAVVQQLSVAKAMLG